MPAEFSAHTLRAAAYKCRQQAAECLAKSVEAINSKSMARWHTEARKMERAADVFDDQAKAVERAAVEARVARAATGKAPATVGEVRSRSKRRPKS